MNSTLSHARIFLSLLLRDMYILRKRLFGLIIDSIIFLVLYVLMIGKFFPLLGMPQQLIGPIFIGSSTNLTLPFFGFTHALKISADLRFSRFIDYHLTLPLPKKWLFSLYIISFIIETGIISLPLLLIGSYMLSNAITLSHTWVLFLFMYLCALVFFGVFFTWIAFHYNFDWLRKNIWPRRLSPLLNLGTNFVPWTGIHALIPLVSYFLLLNPFTYVMEGIRATFLTGYPFLPAFACIPATIIFSGIFIMLLTRSIKKRLDPV
jgi:ABC-2 type transport system permease protein